MSVIYVSYLKSEMGKHIIRFKWLQIAELKHNNPLQTSQKFQNFCRHLNKTKHKLTRD